MEYINEDCITNASDSSNPTSFFSYENIGEPFLQITNSQIETESYYPASSPQVANLVFPGKGTPAAFYKLRRESKKHNKRRDLKHNTLDTVV